MSTSQNKDQIFVLGGRRHCAHTAYYHQKVILRGLEVRTASDMKKLTDPTDEAD
jgi:hypothetical protein